MNVHFHFQLDHKQKVEWTEFWKNCKHSHAQQHWSYGEIERAKRRIPVYVSGDDNGTMKCAGIFSICSHFPGKRFSLEAVCLRGPMANSSIELHNYLIQVIDYFKTLKVGSVRISPYWFYPESEEVELLLKEIGFIPCDPNPDIVNRVFHHILSSRSNTGCVDLTREDDELFASFSKSTRREIRRAERNNITVKPIKKFDAALEFYRHFSIMSNERGLLLPNLSEFTKTFETVLLNEQIGVLLGAYADSVFLGGLWMLKGPISANAVRYAVVRKPLKELSNLRIGPFLWWKGLIWAKERGCPSFDMEGSHEDVDKADPIYRVNQFKKGFNPALSQRISEHRYICNSIIFTIEESLKIWSKGYRLAKRYLHRI